MPPDESEMVPSIEPLAGLRLCKRRGGKQRRQQNGGKRT
jgi:hypothetical protein